MHVQKGNNFVVVCNLQKTKGDKNENADEVTLDNVEVIYYEDSAPYSDNITIQPIYRVRGSSIKDGEEIDEYLGLTSAIRR